MNARQWLGVASGVGAAVLAWMWYRGRSGGAAGGAGGSASPISFGDINNATSITNNVTTDSQGGDSEPARWMRDASKDNFSRGKFSGWYAWVKDGVTQYTGSPDIPPG